MNDRSGSRVMRDGENALTTILERLSELITMVEALAFVSVRDWLLEAERPRASY